MNWTVRFDDEGLDDLDELSKAQKLEIMAIFEEPKDDGPAIHGAIQLRSNQNTCGVRFDNARYRMVYRVSKGNRILITRLKPRGVVYKGLRGYYKDLLG